MGDGFVVWEIQTAIRARETKRILIKIIHLMMEYPDVSTVISSGTILYR